MKPGEKAEGAKNARKRLTDYVAAGQGAQLDGDRIEIEKILGDDIELLDFVFLKGDEKYGGKDFAVIQFHHEGKLLTTSTGAAVIVEALKEMPKQYLPVDVTIIREKGKSSGRGYLTIK